MSRTPLSAWIATKSLGTVWVDHMNVGLRVHGTFNPDVNWIPFVSPQSVYDQRYGVGASNQKGNVVGERFNRDIVMNAINTGLLVGVPVGYFPTRADEEDLKLVAYPMGSNSSIYDTIIVPLGREEPPPVEPPVDPPPVDPPPPPPPIDPPPPTPPLVVPVSTDIKEKILDLVDYNSDFTVYSGMTFIGPGRKAKFQRAKVLADAVKAYVEGLAGVVKK